MTGKKYLPESPLLLRPVHIVIALVFVIAISEYVAYEKSCLQKNTLFPPPFPNQAHCVKNPGAFLLVLLVQQGSKQCGCKGRARVPLQRCTRAMQLLETGGSRDVLNWFSFLSLACLGVSAAAQRASLKSPAAHPGFWWTEKLMWDFSAANFVCPRWGHRFQHFQKAARLMACFNHHQRACPFLFQLQGAAVSQAWVEGGDPPPRLPAQACQGFILCS